MVPTYRSYPLRPRRSQGYEPMVSFWYGLSIEPFFLRGRGAKVYWRAMKFQLCCNVHWGTFTVNLDKLVVFEVFLRYQTFYQTKTVSYCYIKHPGGLGLGLGLDFDLGETHLRCQASFKLYFPKKIAAIDSSRIVSKQCHHHCVPLNMDHPQLGLSVFGGFGGLGCCALKWVGRYLQCVPKKHRKKQQHFFATKRVIMKNPARFIHFALDKVRLLSNFQVILSETGSIFGGSGGA